jgi:hypothetical protein
MVCGCVRLVHHTLCPAGRGVVTWRAVTRRASPAPWCEYHDGIRDVTRPVMMDIWGYMGDVTRPVMMDIWGYMDRDAPLC